MRKLVRLFAVIVTMVLPMKAKRIALRLLFRWDVHPTAHIGWSLIDAEYVKVGAHARIGHFSVIRDLRAIEIGEYARIGQWNWITASKVLVSASSLEERGTFSIGNHSSVTSRHYLDCSGGIEIGSFTTLAGVKSTLLTHQIDVEKSRQTIATINIGDYCLIGSDTKFTPGTGVADRCLVGMGAVVSKYLAEPGMLYVGVPARPVREIGSGEYFHREVGVVSFKGNTQERS